MNPPSTILRLNKPLALSVLVALSGAVFLGFFWNPRGPLVLQVVRVEAIQTSAPTLRPRQVTVSMGNPSSNNVTFIGKQKVQFRIGDQWQPSEICPALADQYLHPGGMLGEVGFTIPAAANACRFTLAYRVGGRPYCKAYFFLNRHGITRKFPRLSAWVLKGFADHRWLRHATVELPLPNNV